MRNTLKIANRLDSFYSMLLMLPVLFMVSHLEFHGR